MDFHEKMIAFFLIIILMCFVFGWHIAEIVMKAKNIEAKENKITEEEKITKEINNNYKVNILVRNKDVNYMYGEATAYTPSKKGINSDSNPKVTSIGEPAKNGVIAVNPDKIPYGSEIMIIHDKTVIRGVAADTGGAMRQNPNQVDILMEDYEKAKKWGRKKVHIIWW